MNRVIKFRAWDDTNKKWAYVGFNLFGEVTIFNLLEQYKFEDACKSLLFQQFTGLTDKNGKEIYEGDILREPAKDHWETINYSCFEVFFHDGDANSDYNIGYTMNRMHNHGSVCGGYIPSFKPKKVSKMIVIGNIHENPELLTPSLTKE